MISFHGNQSLEEYVLTVMNMVADLYRDPSIGTKINIEVSKLMLLYNMPKGLSITHHGDRTLESFCKWQQWITKDTFKENPKYDGAVLLTRYASFNISTQMITRYVEAAVIPEGARSITITESKPCTSFLALRADAGTYYINGNWRIQLPGDVNADGTIFRYMRKGTLEKIVARGPTNAPLHIMVLYYGFNLGVEYRYAVPLQDSNRDKDDAKKHRLLLDASYGWVHGGWGKCNVHCGGGKAKEWKLDSQLIAARLIYLNCGINIKLEGFGNITSVLDNLGAYHDGDGNTCPDSAGLTPHLMSSRWLARNRRGTMKWSWCSKAYIKSFLNSKASKCLRNHAKEKPLELPTELPGVAFTVDEQCKQQYGNRARHCHKYKISYVLRA
ncbi:A disintegrin and metalloproteinase with thrombospondin motifs 19-like [Stylophora pistillata]|uniref:A disintegrin and metalloproteinase with thrombospondin motifs 19-like n=1 Tax=Stylophora pistillata TaxID=50429 RepID=UPI000C0455F5|nr:A disintegrin and metalloproteinase with thrombospondin motifs 19-like [Stylophora pistillata]